MISAAPREVIQSALEGIVPPEHIFGTELDFDESGEIRAVSRVPAGYGKVAVVEELEQPARTSGRTARSTSATAVPTST